MEYKGRSGHLWASVSTEILVISARRQCSVPWQDAHLKRKAEQNLGYLHYTKTLESLSYRQHRTVERFWSGKLSCSYVSFSSLIYKIKKIVLIFSIPFCSKILWFISPIGSLFCLTIGKTDRVRGPRESVRQRGREKENKRKRNEKFRCVHLLITYVSHHAVLSTKEKLTAIWSGQEMERGSNASGSFSFLYLE